MGEKEKEEVSPEWVEEAFRVVQVNAELPENAPDFTRNLAELNQQNQQEDNRDAVGWV